MRSSRPTPKTPASRKAGAKRSRASSSRADRYWVAVSSTLRRLPLPAAAVRRAAVATLEREGADSALISVAFVGRTAIATLNRIFLRRRGATDVISFSLENPGAGSAIVGDIYICPEVARANAKRQGVNPGEELLRLVVHGVLHTLGRDHPEGGSRTSSSMWRRQEEMVAGLD